jgi:hypothetical protein
MPFARQDSRFPPFRNEGGKMGHPFVWLGWRTADPSAALGMTKVAVALSAEIGLWMRDLLFWYMA